MRGRFYDGSVTAQVRRLVEDEVLSWPGVEQTILLDCPSYLVGGHPFALLVDGSLLLPALPPEVLASAPQATLSPLEKDGLALPGWLRARTLGGEDVRQVLPLVRAAYETVRARSAPAP